MGAPASPAAACAGARGGESMVAENPPSLNIGPSQLRLSDHDGDRSVFLLIAHRLR